MLRAVNDIRLGHLVRALRQRRHWRQVDLARRAGVGRSVLSTIELGRLDGVTVATLRRVLAALGLDAEVTVRGLGADVDRVLDERHARLVGATASWLADQGWDTRVEVSYSEWGERGSIDLLAWHAPTRTLLVVEVKTDLASVEATLRKHDEKVRLAAVIASKRLGWRPRIVARLLVLPEESTQRRRVVRHGTILGGAYPARNRAVRTWCRRPDGALAGLLFWADSAASGVTADRGRRERVRAPRIASRERGRA
jgi:transcriptional regulator with XRE-family HTH domain